MKIYASTTVIFMIPEACSNLSIRKQLESLELFSYSVSYKRLC